MAKKKKNFPLFVSIYSWKQVYGGPEEGGWWYWTRFLEAWVEIPAGRNQQSKIRQAKRYLTEYAGKNDIKEYDVIIEKKYGVHESPCQEYC